MKLWEVKYTSSKFKEPQTLWVVAPSGVDAIQELFTRKYKGHKTLLGVTELFEVVIAGEIAPPSPKSAYLREYFNTQRSVTNNGNIS